ncbi:Protein Mis18-beta Cancer/testis antigen 86 [Channa argus]|uniref:Protein Mis18-beta Cancer/testis antigen 86 n=1 Tax=Channa argus TaxID=215402 RepID=A0A6G1QEN1_CHAAH|nr:Protein Mis18-beta Cancer/testis antigen 86 [Channa argus]KAK2892133.1 hypothetical protein Q8A73_017798 [Channa argus]
MEYDEGFLIQRIHDMKLQATAALVKQQMTFHCAQCNTVLADSVGVCGEIGVNSADYIMCLRVTNDVAISERIELGHKEEMANCIFSSLNCQVCCSTVGKIIHSASSHLANIRCLFLLHKANINCYILNNSSMVKASTLKFDLKPLRDSINEVRQEFEAQLDQMSQLKSRLADSSVTSKLDK